MILKQLLEYLNPYISNTSLSVSAASTFETFTISPKANLADEIIAFA